MQFDRSPVFEQAYCCYADFYDPVQFLLYSKLWRATIEFEYKNRADASGPFFHGFHNWEFYAVPKMERFYVGVPEWWRDYEPCRGLEVPKSPALPYLRKEFVDGCKPSSTTIWDICVARSDHFVMMLMAFSTWPYLLRKIATHDLSRHDARMQVGSCEGILFQLIQLVHDLVRSIKMQDVVKGTRFDLLFSLMPARRSDILNWAVEGCLG